MLQGRRTLWTELSKSGQVTNLKWYCLFFLYLPPLSLLAVVKRLPQSTHLLYCRIYLLGHVSLSLWSMLLLQHWTIDSCTIFHLLVRVQVMASILPYPPRYLADESSGNLLTFEEYCKVSPVAGVEYAPKYRPIDGDNRAGLLVVCLLFGRRRRIAWYAWYAWYAGSGNNAKYPWLGQGGRGYVLNAICVRSLLCSALLLLCSAAACALRCCSLLFSALRCSALLCSDHSTPLLLWCD